MEIGREQFEQLAVFVRKNYGIDLRKKKSVVDGRIGGIVALSGFDSPDSYLRHILSGTDPEGVTRLINKLTTNHTFFMREKEHFDFYRAQVLPFAEANTPDRDLRVWCAGCATGEEAYTLAMLNLDYFESKAGWDTQVLATDISSDALNTARKGLYAQEAVAPLPPNWLLRYFSREPEGYRVRGELRYQVLFRSFNLMESRFPFRRKFHAIFCRNVMIYFDEPTKAALIRRFYDMTEPGGYLFIGHSEFIPREATRYRYICPSVYRKEETR